MDLGVWCGQHSGTEKGFKPPPLWATTSHTREAQEAAPGPDAIKESRPSGLLHCKHGIEHQNLPNQ